MELDVIRFSIGPWRGRYSSVWRVWTDKGDVYLAVRALVRYMKVSLHQSGVFRIAFTNEYDKTMRVKGMDPFVDRAFMKWHKIPIHGKQLMQALDIHFPLTALSLRGKPNMKKVVLLQPDENALGTDDSVTVKILFHKMHPDTGFVTAALKQCGLIPGFWIELGNGEYITIAFRYSKLLPLQISKTEMQNYAAMFHKRFTQTGKQVGDVIEDLTIQVFEMGRPPAIYNLGGVSVRWEAETHFSVDVAADRA